MLLPHGGAILADKQKPRCCLLSLELVQVVMMTNVLLFYKLCCYNWKYFHILQQPLSSIQKQWFCDSVKNTAPQTVTLEQKLVVIKHYDEGGQTSTMMPCVVNSGTSALEKLEVMRQTLKSSIKAKMCYNAVRSQNTPFISFFFFF